MCRGLCGVQAQVLGAAKLQIAARCPGVTKEQIDAAISREKSIIKTYGMRGTLHLFALDDVRLFSSAFRESIKKSNFNWALWNQFEADDANKIGERIRELLKDGAKTRDEMADELKDVIDRKYILDPWGTFFRFQCLLGHLCYGDNKGTNTTFTLLHDWVDCPDFVDEVEAQNELARRYLKVNAPATPQDLRYWLGIKVSSAKKILERIKPELVEIKPNTYVLGEDLDYFMSLEFDTEHVALLPFFDAYMLSHADKSEMLEKAYYKRVYKQAGWVAPVVLVNGKVIGTWQYKENAKSVKYTITTFEKISKRRKDSIISRIENFDKYFGKDDKIEFTVTN
ncbi:MAG TPA: winged helix DNA-binding domain-containing protein [Caldisericia bacterium]|nr:winged helix DNA-binding domain-containing protein [Caldisericia bacterium]